MLTIDGSAGGGQLVRTGLALSGLTERDVCIENVRGGRPNPGLRPQHLAVLQTMSALCDAYVEGATEGSETVTFRPRGVVGGHHEVDIGTAGSVTLLFDAVLPLALGTAVPIRVTVTGGTDVRWSPTMAHYRRVKLPLLREAGLNASVDVRRAGFYPAGGGEATLSLAPSTLDEFSLTERGDPTDVRIVSTASSSLRDRDVAERQATAAGETLTDLPVTERTVRYYDARCPGSSLLVAVEFEHARAGFDALGERGTPAEDVGTTAAEAARSFLDGAGVLDRHTADQVLAFLALAGGRVRVPTLTDHVVTSVDLLNQFDLPTSVESVGDGAVVSAPGTVTVR